MYNMKKERSYWEGTHAANRKIMYLAAGYEQEDIVKKPHIGIANTFFEGSPGTGHLRSLAESGGVCQKGHLDEWGDADGVRRSRHLRKHRHRLRRAAL